MAEGAGADIGHGSFRAEVGQLADIVRHLGELGQLVIGEAVYPHLQLEVGYHRAQVGVAAALAVAVYSPLDLAGSRPDRGQGIGHRQVGVIVGMDAQRHIGYLNSRLDGGADLIGQGAAVGVAQHQAVGAGIGSRLQDAQGVAGIGLVAVEVMLGVEENGDALPFQMLDGIGYHGQVLL